MIVLSLKVFLEISLRSGTDWISGHSSFQLRKIKLRSWYLTRQGLSSTITTLWLRNFVKTNSLLGNSSGPGDFLRFPANECGFLFYTASLRTSYCRARKFLTPQGRRWAIPGLQFSDLLVFIFLTLKWVPQTTKGYRFFKKTRTNDVFVYLHLHFGLSTGTLKAWPLCCIESRRLDQGRLVITKINGILKQGPITFNYYPSSALEGYPRSEATDRGLVRIW